MNDLVERLRQPCHMMDCLMARNQAADEIERLNDHADIDEDFIAQYRACVNKLDDYIVLLEAVVEVAKIARTPDELGLLSVERGWDLDKALIKLDEYIGN